MTHQTPALATSIASRLAATGKALAGIGLATLFFSASPSASAAPDVTTNTAFWTADVDNSNFDNSYSPVFTVLPYASVLHFSPGFEYAHSHGGPLVVGVQVRDAKTGQWVTIGSVRLNNGDEFDFGNLTLPFMPTSITQVRLFSTPGQDQSFHDWESVTLSFSQASINPVGHTWKSSGFLPGSLANLGTLKTSTDEPFQIGQFFRQESSGKLVISIGSKDKFSRLNVGYAASLDGTLATQTVHGYKVSPGQKFTFLTANDGIFGTFGKTETGTILGLNVIYDFNSTTLEFTQGSFEEFAAGQHLSRNQYAVAEALDKSVAAGKTRDLIRFLDNESLDTLPSQLDRVSPEELTSIFTLGVAYAQVQSLNLQRRTDDIRSGSNGFSAGGLAINGSNPGYSGAFRTGVAGPNGNELRGDGKDVKESKEVVAAESRWGAFLSGTGEWVNVSGTDNARGYALSSGGFTLGVDYKVTPNLAIGLAAGYTGTTADLTDRGRVWVNGGKIGLYGTFFQNEQVAQAPTMSKDSSKDSKEVQAPMASVAKGFYADVAVFGGYNSYDTRRASVNGEARGDTDGGELNVLFGTGYDFKKGGLTFGPTATFNYTYVGLNGFTEHDSLAPLNIHGGDAESLRTALGFKASYDWKVGGLTVKPELRAAWQHEFGDSTYSLNSSFADGGASTFNVSGPRLGRDSLLVGAGFAVQCSERCATYLYYDGELLRENYISNAVTGGVRISF